MKSCLNITNSGLRNGDDDSEMDSFSRYIDQMFSKVNELEEKVNAIEQFYMHTDKKQANPAKYSSILRDKGRNKHFMNNEKQQRDAFQTEAAAEKRMEELMHQFAVIFHQVTQHDWAWPFMQPVDVNDPQLHDYYEVIEKPMDFGTIKKRMEAKDGTGYKNVREIYSDVRLVLKNAMKYNDEKNDVHRMARYLLEKFEKKWLQLLPKVAQEEERRLKEEATLKLATEQAQEASHSTMARDLSNELDEVDLHLEKFRETVVQHCRKIPSSEKKKLWAALNQLPPEDLIKALEIVAETNPSFQATAEEVDLDIDAQSDLTLWRLKLFVQDALKRKISADMDVNNNNVNKDSKEIFSSKSKNITVSTTTSNSNKKNSKRRREICDALAKTTVNKTRKISLIP